MTKQQRFYHVANILQEIAGMALEADLCIWYDWAAHVSKFNVRFYPFMEDPSDYYENYACSQDIRIWADELMEKDLNSLIEALKKNDLLYTINNN
jgi:hypothetical protein